MGKVQALTKTAYVNVSANVCVLMCAISYVQEQPKPQININGNNRNPYTKIKRFGGEGRETVLCDGEEYRS